MPAWRPESHTKFFDPQKGDPSCERGLFCGGLGRGYGCVDGSAQPGEMQQSEPEIIRQPARFKARISAFGLRCEETSLTIERIAASVLVLALLGVAFGPLRQLRHTLRPTALRMAWPWFCLAWIAWFVALGLRLAAESTDGLRHAAWYVAAVATLAPLIAVLGGRWPTSRVWSLFVVLPLLLVLSWPVAAVCLGMARWDRFELETPMLLGGLLVSVMGWGNFVGSRWTFEALLGMVGTMLLLWSLTPEISPSWLPADRCALLLAGVLACVSVSIGRRARHSPSREPADDPVWMEFQTVFGMVWSRRIQDRVNEQARAKHWPVRLGGRGWHDTSGQPLGLVADSGPAGQSGAGQEMTTESATEGDARGFLLWLLQKFVEPEWIARHDAPQD